MDAVDIAVVGLGCNLKLLAKDFFCHAIPSAFSLDIVEHVVPPFCSKLLRFAVIYIITAMCSKVNRVFNRK